LFSLAALAGILLIGPKYVRREAKLERKAQAREEVALRAKGLTPIPPAKARPNEPADLRVPLWRLAIVVAVIMVVSLVGLMFTRWRAAVRGRLPEAGP
jgi:hypothetical protein